MGNLKFSEKIIITRTPAEVFDYSQDYEQRLSWDTFLQRADIIDGATEAAMGVKTYCVAKNGIGMETEYVSFNRPQVTAVKMTKGPFMFSAFLGSWRFKALDATRTEVVFLYSFQLRFPFTLFSRFITVHLRKNVRQRLRDLKANLETTEGVTGFAGAVN